MHDRPDSILTERARRDSTRHFSWLGVLWRTARVFILAYLIVLFLAMWLEESLIFFPSKYPVGEWNQTALAVEDAEFEAEDGTRLHGWFVPREDPLAHVLYLHGNAGNLSDRLDALWHLHHDVGVAVLIIDYRGYGKSEGGPPNEKGVLQDARAGRTWLAQRAGIDEGDIVLLGRSLGGGIAVDLTMDVVPRALVLQNVFTSLPDVAAVHYPFLPVRTLMSTRLETLEKIKRYTGPLLQCHGTRDEVVPFQQGEQVFSAAGGENKQFIELPGFTHNDPLPAEYYARLKSFLESLDRES